MWHCLLISWLGAAGPDQSTYRWLREANLAKPFGHATPDVVSEIYRRVRIRVEERGLCAVFSGDISSVLFRLQPSQDSLFHDWFSSVPDNMAALRSGVSPQTLVKFLRRAGCFYVLTVKVIFVHLSCVCPHVVDTTHLKQLGENHWPERCWYCPIAKSAWFGRGEMWSETGTWCSTWW